MNFVVDASDLGGEIQLALQALSPRATWREELRVIRGEQLAVLIDVIVVRRPPIFAKRNLLAAKTGYNLVRLPIESPIVGGLVLRHASQDLMASSIVALRTRETM
jgi:hypothetical protein